MRPSLCIDLGSAYTKIGFRELPSSRTRLLKAGGASIDEHHVCVPSVAAWRERDDRWAFGLDAADLVEGDGIRVFRNWKPDLFPERVARVTALARGGTRPILAALEEEEQDALRAGPGSRERARIVGRKYLAWVREELVPEMLPGMDPGEMTLRLCIPEFSMYTPRAAEMDRMLESVGWFNPVSYCCSEPMANLTGALTQGKNAVIEPRTGRMFADVPAMFAASHLLEVGRTSRARHEDAGEYATLIVDIGAYTTDFGLISVDLAGNGFFPLSETRSVPLGIHELDRRVAGALPEPVKSLLQALPERGWDRFHRVVYAERQPWELPGGNVVGHRADQSRIIRETVAGFAGEIVLAMERFLSQHRPPRVQEVILTGGGTHIPDVADRVCAAISGRGVATFYLPRESRIPGKVNQVLLDAELTRGASALGGASVLFDLA